MLGVLSPLILALLALLGPVRITLSPDPEVMAYDSAHRSPTNPDGAYAATARVSCHDSVPDLLLTVPALNDPVTVAHELLHAADCADNGLFDGSPEPTACAEVPDDCAHSWVYWAFRHRDEAIARIGRLPAPPVLRP